MTIAGETVLEPALPAPAIARERRNGWKPAALLLPAGLLIGLLLLCSFSVLRMSFGDRNAEWSGWSLVNYAVLLHGRYLRIVIDTVWLAFLSAVLTTLISFPIALYMTRTPSALARRIVLICVMLPMLISLLVQSFGWMAILGPDGLLNQAARFVTGYERSFSLLFNRTGVLARADPDHRSAGGPADRRVPGDDTRPI